jgi:hypothetical protein
MITYAQIEAIHEAMRELEEKEVCDYEPYAVDSFVADDVHRCLVKIRAALAGEVKDASNGSP